MTQSTFPPIEELIPHRKPMLLLDAITLITDDCIQAESVIGEDCLFLQENGTLEPVACMEMLAQCFAGGHCLSQKSSWGYLAAMKKMEVLGTVHKGDTVRAEVRATAQLGSIVVVEGKLYKDNDCVLQGQFKIYIPEESHA